MLLSHLACASPLFTLSEGKCILCGYHICGQETQDGCQLMCFLSQAFKYFFAINKRWQVGIRRAQCVTHQHSLIVSYLKVHGSFHVVLYSMIVIIPCTHPTVSCARSCYHSMCIYFSFSTYCTVFITFFTPQYCCIVKGLCSLLYSLTPTLM